MRSPTLGFVLADVTRLMRRAFRARLQGSALTQNQARVLVHLSRNPDIRQIELADRLEMQPIALSRVIDQLAGTGLVRRETDPDDRRAYRLTSTPSAEPELAAIDAVMSEIQGEALRGIDPHDAEIAQSVLDRMRDNLASRS